MRILSNVCALVFAAVALPLMASERVDKTLALNDASNVSVENLRGRVEINGWNKSEVHVKGKLDEKAEGFVFEQEGSSIKIKVLMPRHMNSGWNDKGSDLVIHVPSQVRVDFSGVSTDVSLSHLAKSTEVKTVSGNIRAEDLTQHVELTTVSGDIDGKQLEGKVTLSSVSGDIIDRNSNGRLKLKAVSGNINTHSSAKEVSLNTVSGEIELALAETDELNISTVSGDVDGELSLNDNGLVKMSSVSGNIDLAFENDVEASFRMKSNAGGDLINRITSDKAQHAKYGPSSKLYFETGNANASVKASTVSGRIKVSKK